MAKLFHKPKLGPSARVIASLIVVFVPIAFFFQNCGGGFQSLEGVDLHSHSLSDHYQWSVGEWSACSGACGMESRTVTCNRYYDDLIENAPEAMCSGSKPETNQVCSCDGSPTVPPADGNQEPPADETGGPTSDQTNHFDFQILDPNNLLGANREKILAQARAAGVQWSQHIKINARIQVDVIVRDTETNRFSGRSLANIKIGTFEGRDVLEDSMPHKARTGIDVNGAAADGEIVVDPDYINSQLWLDPYPYERTSPVPNDKLDAVSVFMHELGHGLGFNGFRNRTTGALPATYMSVYDKFISIDGLDVTFNGPRAVTVFGSNVPLCFLSGNTQNLYHYGNPLTANVPLEYGLMTGYNYMYRTRYWINNLDVAILEDLGLSRGP